jgi:hypothetical protein
MAQQVELPAMGRADDRAAAWSRQVPTQPDASPLRVESAPPSPFRRRDRATQAGEAIDVNQLLGRLSGRTLLLVGVCLVVVALAGLSFLAPGSTPSSARVAGRGPALPAQSAPKRKAPAAAVQEQRTGSQQESTTAAARAATEAVAATAPPPAKRAEHVSATPQRAAVLYIEGKYREALAEYRLLAAAYPDQRVYAELARILKRKIIDTCVRTQPNRREQCKSI